MTDRTTPQVARWPFAESPGEVANKLFTAYALFHDDMLAAVRNVFIEQGVALASTPTPAVEGGQAPDIDYAKLVADCFTRTKQAQGTIGCVQFARGAEWFREQVIAALANKEQSK